MTIKEFKERVNDRTLFVNGAKYCVIKDVAEVPVAPSYLALVPYDFSKTPYFVAKARVKSAHVKAGQIDILPAAYNKDLINIIQY